MADNVLIKKSSNMDKGTTGKCKIVANASYLLSSTHLRVEAEDLVFLLSLHLSRGPFCASCTDSNSMKTRWEKAEPLCTFRK
jgi:hypothetical protein